MVFLIVATLWVANKNLIVVLICISLMAYKIENLFIHIFDHLNILFSSFFNKVLCMFFPSLVGVMDVSYL